MPLEKVITYVSAALAHTLLEPLWLRCLGHRRIRSVHRIIDNAGNSVRAERARTYRNGWAHESLAANRQASPECRFGANGATYPLSILTETGASYAK